MILEKNNNINNNIQINEIEINDNNNIEIYPKNKNILTLSPSAKKTKKVKKKKKKRKSIIDNQNDPPTESVQDAIQNIKPNNNIKKKNNNEKQNGNINDNEIPLNEGREGEINKIKNSNRPFGNLKFNNKNARSHNRNEISKGQFSMQKDQTDRGLLKSNI